MNNDIQENYCSFEVSKLLKEKGFDLHCDSYYYDKRGTLREYVGNYNSTDQEELHPHSSRPTHDLAIQWIRKNFRPDYALNLFPYKIRNKLLWEVRIFGHHFASSGYKLPTDAIDIALFYTLQNLI